MYYSALIDDKCFLRQIRICMNALLFSLVEALQLVSSQWTAFLPSSLAEGFSFSLEPFSGTLFPESGCIQKNGELQATNIATTQTGSGREQSVQAHFPCRYFFNTEKRDLPYSYTSLTFFDRQSKNFPKGRRVVTTVGRKMA